MSGLRDALVALKTKWVKSDMRFCNEDEGAVLKSCARDVDALLAAHPATDSTPIGSKSVDAVLPELSEPVSVMQRIAWGPQPDYYTAEQMHAYALDAAWPGMVADAGRYAILREHAFRAPGMFGALKHLDATEFDAAVDAMEASRG